MLPFSPIPLGFAWLASVQPKRPPDDIIETRQQDPDEPPPLERDQWEYGVGPRGGSLRRKADIVTKYFRRQKYVLVPNAPAFRDRPFGTYCHFVPSGKWIPFTESEYHQDPIRHDGDWKYDRTGYTPEAVRTFPPPGRR